MSSTESAGNGKGQKSSLPVITPDAVEQDQGDQIDNVVPSRGYKMLPVIGLGGSAGGIKALQEFFQAMPPDSGMAFVVILHLAPDHESTLAEVLARSTSMRVFQAQDGQRFEPDCVYVIPPGKFLTVHDESIRLTELQPVAGRRVTIDLFFRALADTHGPHSTAVILSGADGDGALGIKRIKERGGLTISQDPEEADHPGMPRAAIETGMVDWVLRVKEMPMRLLAYRQYEKRIKAPAEEPPAEPVEKDAVAASSSEPAFREALAYLKVRTGHDFSYYKRATIVRRLSRRMQVNGIEDVPSYLIYLRTHPGEAEALLQDLLISVTNFFRDREAFQALEGHLPLLFKGKTGSDVVRVWVAACATGEEAYSIAMLLIEYARAMEDPPSLQVFATDIDESAVQAARAGFYPETIAADVSEDRLRRFFIKESHGYRVKREMREIVLFAVQDLLKDSPFSKLDLITCRNLLIYLNREAQQKALEIMHFALRPNGLLFLGISESAGDVPSLFQPLDAKRRIYAQTPTARARVPALPGSMLASRAYDSNEGAKPAFAMPQQSTIGLRRMLTPALTALLEDEVERASWSEIHFKLLERLGPPSVIINRNNDILHLSESAGNFLNISGGEPTMNLLRLVNPSLRIELRSLLHRVNESKTAAQAFNIPIALSGVPCVVDISVSLAAEIGEELMLVTFLARQTNESEQTRPKAEPEAVVQGLEKEVERLRAQFNGTVDQYEASTEELKASNEELQAINEELRTATEELETSREELQSMNEELTTVNHELKSKVDEVARTNSDLHNLMAATSIATVFVDRDLRIVRFTPSALSIFRLIPTDIGRPLSDLSHQLAYKELISDSHSVVETLTPVEREVRAKSGNWYLARILPYRTLDDHIDGVVLTFVDITRRKLAEESLRISNERLRLMVENAREFAIFAMDMERRVTAWNSGGEHLLQYKEPAILGKSADVVFTPEDRAAGAPEAEAATAISEGRAVDERWHQRKDGSRFWGSGYLMLMRTAEGEPCGFVKILHDRTKAKETEEALQQSREQLELALKEMQMARKAAEDAGKIKDRFLAVLSHELRTPLTPILMAAESLLRRRDLPPRAMEALEMIRRNIEVETHFIDDLLDITNISRGTLEVRRTAMDVHAAALRAIEIVDERFRSKAQMVEVALNAPRHVMHGDFQRMQQVFWNLLINASKFTPEGGRIKVSSRLEDSKILIEIHDTGRGIDPNVLPDIFEAFKQGDDSIVREHGGLGLGLAIAKATVEALGGKIEAASDGKGRGSTFTVCVPLFEEPPSTSAKIRETT